MSAALAVAASPATAAPERALLLHLSRQEAVRMLRHPLMLFGFGIAVVAGAQEVGATVAPRDAFEAVSSMLSFYPGIFTILVGGLMATRDRRAESLEMLTPVPGRPTERTLALVIASFAPALVALLLALSLHGYYLATGRYVEAPGLAHVLQGPVTIVGGMLLGVMVATWAPARSTAVVTMVAMVAANVWLSGDPDLQLFGPLMFWARWGATPSSWVGVFDGSPGWHLVYLVGLSAMAATAALVRVAERRTPLLLASAGVAVAVAVLGGVAQLP